MLDAEVWTRITDAPPSTAVTLDAAQEDSTALRAELARAEKQERALTQAIRRTASSTALDAADIDAVVAEQTEQREVLRERIANIKAQIGDANEREALRRQAISAHETAKFLKTIDAETQRKIHAVFGTRFEVRSGRGAKVEGSLWCDDLLAFLNGEAGTILGTPGGPASAQVLSQPELAISATWS